MKFGDGCHERTTWCCWLLFAGTMLFTDPATELAVGADITASINRSAFIVDQDCDDARGTQLQPLRKVDGVLSDEFVVATVNGDEIRLGEVFSAYSNWLQRARRQRGPNDFRALQEHLAQRDLPVHIDRLLCLQALRVELSDKHWAALARELDQRFEPLIDKLRDQFQVSDRQELQAELLRRGTSLEILRECYKREALASEFLGRRLPRPEKGDRKAAASAIQAELREKANVRTVFDDLKAESINSDADAR